MLKNQKVICIIPARKGSKGLKNKNIKKLEPGSLLTIRDASIKTIRSTPFHFNPSSESENVLIDEMVESIINATKLRSKNQKNISI